MGCTPYACCCNGLVDPAGPNCGVAEAAACADAGTDIVPGAAAADGAGAGSGAIIGGIFGILSGSGKKGLESCFIGFAATSALARALS